MKNKTVPLWMKIINIFGLMEPILGTYPRDLIDLEFDSDHLGWDRDEG